VTVADGHGGRALGRLAGEEEGRAVVELTEARRVELPGPLVSVALAPPTGERLAWAVQKLAELGVHEVILMQTERSVRRWEGDRAKQAVARLRAVAREAAMQSRQAFVAEVWGGFTLGGALDAGDAPVLMLWEGAAGGVGLQASLPEAAPAVRIVVGPEGGFTEAEMRAARQAGAVPVSLGPNILRTETAAIAGAALVLARYGRLG
jgi:16S rRNA (uracil1498-N3)-methyltransferase